MTPAVQGGTQQMRVRHQDRLTRTRRRGGGHRPAPAVDPADLPVSDACLEVRRHRAAGGPEDAATYDCECGAVFRADVTASVACPHCGSDQAW
jgi:hypothetical protein